MSETNSIKFNFNLFSIYFFWKEKHINGRAAGSKAVADVNVILERNGANSINVI